MKKVLKLILILSQISSTIFLVNAFDSEQLFDFLTTEDAIIKDLKEYINQQKERIQTLETNLKKFELEHQKASTNPDQYFSIPTNVFLLHKRLTTDYQNILNLVNNTITQKYLERSATRLFMFNFPDQNDLATSAWEITRLQDIYNLYSKDIANGVFNGTDFGTRFSAEDCYSMGLMAYNLNDHHYTDIWLQEALRRLDTEEQPSIPKVKIIEYLSFSAYRHCSVLLALDLTKQVLKLDPSNELALSNSDAFFKEILKQNQTVELKGDDGREDIPVSNYHVTPRKYEHLNPTDGMKTIKLQRIFEKGCIGKLQSGTHRLQCKLEFNQSSYSKIPPLFIEEISSDPYIAILHNYFTEDELKLINDFENKSHGTGKTNLDSNLLKRLVFKLNNFTKLSRGLKVKSMKIKKYRAGQGLNPELKQAEKIWEQDKKITAILKIFLSDTVKGGATVFPYADQVITPKKGLAVFFDVSTIYGECPPLIGYKSVANIFYERA